MSYQDVIDKVDGFGPYQKRLCLLLFISTFTCAIGTLTMIFTIYDPGFRCRIPELDNVTHPDYSPSNNIGDYIPWDDNKQRPMQCEQYVTHGGGAGGNSTAGTPLNGGNRSIVECEHGWIFNKTEYNTVVTEFELVCSRGWRRPLTISLFMMGEAIGSLSGGAFSDRFGRRNVFLISKLAEFIIYFLIGMTTDYMSYVWLRWLEGVFVYLPYTTAFVLGNELMSSDRRNTLSLFIYGGYCTGAAAIPLLGWLVTDWHWLMRVVGLSGLIYVPYYWLIPESPFWLLSTGRYDDAKKLLTKIATYNGVKDFDAEEAVETFREEEKLEEKRKLELRLNNPEPEEGETAKYGRLVLQMLGNRTLCIRILIAYLSWIVTNGVYYGLALNVTSLNGNRFINSFISGLLEFPGILVGFFAIQKLGRPLSLSATMGIGGLCLAIAPFLTDTTMMNTMIIGGKTAIISAFYINFSVTGEMAPTLFRNLAVGSCSAFGKIGSFVAPYLLYLGKTTSEFVPYMTMGSCALLSAALTFFFLPETKGTVLPGTIEEAVQLKPYLAHRRRCKQRKVAIVSEEMATLKGEAV